jgi:hypothetical protein
MNFREIPTNVCPERREQGEIIDLLRTIERGAHWQGDDLIGRIRLSDWRRK